MAIFDINIQKTQGLRFVNLNRSTLPQTYDDRLVNDLIYSNSVSADYCQPFQKSDYLRLHYRTDYSVYTLYLIDPQGNSTNITSSQDFISTDVNGLNYYDLPINLNLLSGSYYVLINLNEAGKPIVNFQSEKFTVNETVNNSLWIECYGNERSYDDGQVWQDRQGIRVVGRMRDYELAQTKNVHDSVNYTPQTDKAKPNMTAILDVNNCPKYILEKINLFLNHDSFWVDGIKYNNDESVGNEPLGKLLRYKSQIKLIETEYQDGNSVELTGDLPPIEYVGIAISDTVGLAIGNTVGTEL